MNFGENLPCNRHVFNEKGPLSEILTDFELMTFCVIFGLLSKNMGQKSNLAGWTVNFNEKYFAF